MRENDEYPERPNSLRQSANILQFFNHLMISPHPASVFKSPLKGARSARRFVVGMLLLAVPLLTRGAVLWSHPDSVMVSTNGKGGDILKGAIKPHDSNSVGTIYFRVLVDPISDTAAKV